MANNKVDTTKLISFLKQGKQGKTANDVANKFTVTPATARKYLAELSSTGTVYTNGVKETGNRGRPAQLFTAY